MPTLWWKSKGLDHLVKDSHDALGVGKDLYVTTQDSRPHRFGSDFVEGHRKRYGKRPPESRQLTYDIAAEDEYAPWRQWLDVQLALLPDQASGALAGKVWLDEHFWPVNFELAAGAGLRAAGLRVVYEQAWDGLSPDWTVVSESGEPLAFVEVHTDMPSPETFGRMRAWHGLVERIKAIPVPVVLQLASSKPISPPDARTAKRIYQDTAAVDRDLGCVAAGRSCCCGGGA